MNESVVSDESYLGFCISFTLLNTNLVICLAWGEVVEGERSQMVDYLTPVFPHDIILSLNPRLLKREFQFCWVIGVVKASKYS